MKNKFLITGGCGFIGYNFLEKCKKLRIPFLVLDKLTYSSNKFAEKELKKITFLKELIFLILRLLK